MKSTGERELPVLPSKAILPGCMECGACCRDVDILLSQEELHLLDQAGTDFLIRRTAAEPKSAFEDGRKLYRMLGWCGNLVLDPETCQFTCKIYDDPRRPAICQQFSEGGPNCRTIQLQQAVISENDLAQPGVEQYLTELIFGEAGLSN